MRKIKKINLKDDSGQAMILTLLCMTILLGFVGFAADIGIMFRTKRNMQIAADGAAIAAAAELNYGNSATAGQAAAAQNGVLDGVNGAAVIISSGPLYGAFAGNPLYVEAIVTKSQPTFFAKMFNQNSMTVGARAVATLGPGRGCIYTLSPAGAGIAINGAMTISMQTCSIVDNSNSTPGLTAGGGATVNAQSIGVVGGYSNSGATLNPTPVTGIVPVSDPLGFLTPPAFVPGTCLPDPAVSTTQTLTQGCYNRLTITGAPTVTFSPGVYVINGAFSITGAATLTGTDVTFYFPNSTASFNTVGTATLNLSAPTTGTYNGILFYQDPSDTNALSVTAAGSSTLEGIFYVPTANVTLSGSGTTNFYASIVAASVALNGTGTFQEYATVNNSSLLTAATLVE